MKKLLCLTCIIVLSIIATCAGASTVTETPFVPYTITDINGDQTEITKPIERIVTIWNGVYVLATMIGGEDKIVSVPASTQVVGSWMATVRPKLLTLPPCIGSDGAFNAEEMLAQSPDIVLYSDTKLHDQMQLLGVPAIFVAVYSFDDIKKVTRIIGKLCGREAAAEAFCNDFDGTLDMVAKHLQAIPQDERRRVYHLWGTALRSNGDKTITNEWIQAAGGINTMKSYISSTTKEISMELLLQENPEVIFLGNYTKALLADDAAVNPAWKELDAIANDRVYKCPAGVTSWDRYSAESPLMVVWAAVTMYPEAFADFDLKQYIKDDYLKHFSYALTDDQVERILTAQLPE